MTNSGFRALLLWAGILVILTTISLIFYLTNVQMSRVNAANATVVETFIDNAKDLEDGGIDHEVISGNMVHYYVNKFSGEFSIKIITKKCPSGFTVFNDISAQQSINYVNPKHDFFAEVQREKNGNLKGYVFTEI